MNATSISYLLGIFSVLGIWLAGKHDWRGWAFMFLTEPVWGWFSIVTHAWGLLAATFAYSIVSGWNVIKWRREPRG